MPNPYRSPLNIPPTEYNQLEEARFRRELGRYLGDLAESLRVVSRGADTPSSLKSKRDSFPSVPIGISEH